METLTISFDVIAYKHHRANGVPAYTAIRWARTTKVLRKLHSVTHMLKECEK